MRRARTRACNDWQPTPSLRSKPPTESMMASFPAPKKGTKPRPATSARSIGGEGGGGGDDDGNVRAATTGSLPGSAAVAAEVAREAEPHPDDGELEG